MIIAVAKQSPAVSAMQAAAAKGYALMGGTTAMRAAGETYLPKFTAESTDNYTARLKASWLFNAYRKTVRDMTGRVFGKPVEIVDGPPLLIDWSEDIDLAGRDLSTFARTVFEDALGGVGISWIMVDAPLRQGTITQAQAKSQNLRPYMVKLGINDILGWRSESIANVQTLTQIRIKECMREADTKDEFADIEAEQIRVLDRTETGVQVRLFRKADGKDWTLWGEPYMTGLPEITVAPFYANRTGFFTGAPLMDDLADTNVAHWQSQSDQRHILHFARVPILFGAGVEDNIVIGAGAVVTAQTADAKLSYVEHTGASIEAGERDLARIEAQMEAYGLQLLIPRASAQSATGEALDAAKETSQLAMTADALSDCLEQALAWMCQYGGFGDVQPTVEVTDDFGVKTFNAQDIMALLQAVKDGELSRITALEEMKRRGWLRSDLSPEEELQRIEEDQVTMPSAGQMNWRGMIPVAPETLPPTNTPIPGVTG